MKITGHRNIVKAAEIIAQDNGAINRLERFVPEKFNVTASEATLGRVDLILGVVSDEVLDVLCTGEESEVVGVLDLFRDGYAVSQMLLEIFEQI
jgi:hypothetical protein